MTDLEMTKLCAEAMGYKVTPHPNRKFGNLMWLANSHNWNPLKDDAQAMALVKKFNINIIWFEVNAGGGFEPTVYMWPLKPSDLNRAIVECVAKMRLAQTKASSENPPEAWYEHGDPNKDDDPGHVNE